MVHVVQVPQVQIIEKTVEFPVVQSAQSTRTPENLATVPVREMKPVATVAMVEVGSPLPAVPVSTLSMTAPVVDVPPVMMECAQQPRVDELLLMTEWMGKLCDAAETAVGSLPLLDGYAVPAYNQVRQELFIAELTTQNTAVISINALARAHDVTPLPDVDVGDTGFDSLWNYCTRRCEVIRSDDRDFAGQMRDLYAHENPNDWRSGSWIPRRFFRPDGKRARLHF